MYFNEDVAMLGKTRHDMIRNVEITTLERDLGRRVL